MASNFFSSEHASEVANLVSKSYFGTTHNTHNNKEHNNGKSTLSLFLRLFGLDQKKIGAITVNALILVSQMIDTSFSMKNKSKSTEQLGSFEEWMSDNSNVANIMEHSKKATLVDDVLEYIKERSADEDSGCIQLVFCKFKPFISRMQSALADKENIGGGGREILFKYLPSHEDIASNGDKCEEMNHYCTFL